MYKQRIETWEIDTNRAKNEGRRSPRKPQVQIINIQPSEENLADFNDVPGEWVYVYLNSIGDLERGKSKHRPRNDSKLFENGIYPFVQTGEVKAADKYIRQFSKAYNDFGLSQSKLWPVNTLCITIAANIAESAFLAIDACFPDSVVGFKAFDSIVLPEYVYYFMESVKQRIAAYAPATAQKNINLETLENLIIPICSIAEQDAIVQETESRLSVCEKMEEAIEQCLSKAKALHQSLLKKAFEGKLVPQDPNDEPAEKLLERIRAEKETQNVGSRITKRRINK
jgi:type I restriction enzyme S subunit